MRLRLGVLVVAAVVAVFGVAGAAQNSAAQLSRAQTWISASGAQTGWLGTSFDEYGLLSGERSDMTGTVTFKLYGPDQTTCSGKPLFISRAEYPWPPNGVPHSDSFTPNRPGEYRWIVSYSGDDNNTPSTSICNETGSVSTIYANNYCPDPRLRFTIEPFDPNTTARFPQVPGVRIKVNSSYWNVIAAELSPSFRYEARGKTRIMKLEPLSLSFNASHRLLFAVPPEMRRQLREATGHVSRNVVKFRLGGKLRIPDRPEPCTQDAGTKSLELPISGVANPKLANRLLSRQRLRSPQR